MAEKKRKVLFVATVDSHIELFHLPYLKMFHDKGWEVHVATETGKKIPYCDKKIKLPIKRSPFKLISNHRAIKKLREVAKKEKYDIVHCHTPVGGVVARLACKKLRREGLRMIYTAHGFHFYTGAPVHYWMMFYPVEWYLANYTDTLITINDEDYQRAKKRFSKRCRDIQYVPGVGVDEKKFEKKLSAKEKHALRESLGLKDDDKVLICVGRLDKNKNQGFLIWAMKELVDKDSAYQLLLVGPDELNGKYQKLADKAGVRGHVKFLGFRKDIPELLQISDIAVSSSKREGLPVNLIEAAMVGLPIVATDCRGCRDVCMIFNRVMGGQANIIVGYNSVYELTEKVEKATDNISLSKKKEVGAEFRSFCIDVVKKRFEEVYRFANCRSLSIIIPAYNCEDYINDCLESIISQKDGYDLEVVIVNDGSTDETEKICDYYSSRYNFIKVYRQKNAGVSNARNNGFKKASGDYVYFVDADDILLPNCIKNIFMLMEYSPDIISVGCKKITGNNVGKDIKSFRFKIINEQRKTLESLRGVSLWQNILKRSIILANNLRLDESLKYTEDMDLVLSVLMSANRIVTTNAKLYGYRKNNISVTSTINAKRIADMRHFIDKWSKHLDQSPNNGKDVFGNFLAYQLLIMIGMMATLDNKKVPFKKYERLLIKYHNSFKTRIGYLCYVLFGINRTAQIMSSFLMSKKLLVKEDNE